MKSEFECFFILKKERLPFLFSSELILNVHCIITSCTSTTHIKLKNFRIDQFYEYFLSIRIFKEAIYISYTI